MKLLFDNALSPVVAERLTAGGFEAVHVRELGMRDAPDAEIFERAKRDGLIIVSADIDFTKLVTLNPEPLPSLILFRRGLEYHPHKQAALLLANLPQLANQLDQGSVVIFEEGRIRIRALPTQKRK